MRLTIKPLNPMGVEGLDVRLELINSSRREVEVHAAWEPGESGSAHDYLIAATQFDCFPPLPPVMGATSAARDRIGGGNAVPGRDPAGITPDGRSPDP